MGANPTNKLIHILNGSYDAVRILRSYLSPIDLLCFQLATKLPQFHFGIRSPSNSLDVTSALKDAGVSNPKAFLESLQATNSAFVTGDLFPILGLPKTDGWWSFVVTPAGEELGLSRGVPWEDLPTHLVKEVFQTQTEDWISHLVTPSKNLRRFLRQWAKLRNGKGVITMIYNNQLELVWIEGDDHETLSDIVPASTMVSILSSPDEDAIRAVDTLDDALFSIEPLFHDPGFCVNLCKVPQGIHCTVPRDVERLEYYTEVEVYATDIIQVV